MAYSNSGKYFVPPLAKCVGQKVLRLLKMKVILTHGQYIYEDYGMVPEVYRLQDRVSILLPACSTQRMSQLPVLGLSDKKKGQKK